MKNRVLSEIRIVILTYVTVFAISAASVTFSFFIFFHGVDAFTREMIEISAKRTFYNLLFLSFILTAVSFVWRYFTVLKPTSQISDALENITSGDFDTKIEINKSFGNFAGIADKVNIAAAELSSVEMLKSDFISAVSHEMKTPLAAIKNYSQLLKTATTDSERDEYTDGIIRSQEKMNKLIMDILRLGKLENNAIPSKISEFDITGAITECLLMFENEINDKNISLDLGLDDTVMINSDREILDLVWNNLISNAVKFTPENGVIKIAVTKNADGVEVTVRDSGVGMDKKTLKHIYDKFYQADPSRSTRGNGLGLAIVKVALKSVGGEISAVSKLGEGTEFTVKLH